MNATFTYGVFGALVMGMLAVAVAIWVFWLLVLGIVAVVLYAVVVFAVEEWKARRTRTQVRLP